MDTTDEHSRTRGNGLRRVRAAGAVKFGRALYQQVAAVLGAIGMAAVVDQFWHVGWRGTLASLVGIWADTVRPVVATAFHVLVTMPMGWFGLYVGVPLAVRDYVSVGLVLSLSTFREVKNDDFHSPSSFWEDALLVVGVLLIWPLLLILYIIIAAFFSVWLTTKGPTGHGFFYDALNSQRRSGSPDLSLQQLKDESRRTTLSFVRRAAPIVYLGLLLAINYLILK